MSGTDRCAGFSRADGVVTSLCEGMRDGVINSRARVERGSPWFEGHFPGEPILPGIAQLGLVLETVRSSSDRPMRLAGVRRVRFKRVVGPGDEMNILVTRRSREPRAYSFRIYVDNVVVCSGTLDML